MPQLSHDLLDMLIALAERRVAGDEDFVDTHGGQPRSTSSSMRMEPEKTQEKQI